MLFSLCTAVELISGTEGPCYTDLFSVPCNAATWEKTVTGVTGRRPCGPCSCRYAVHTHHPVSTRVSLTPALGSQALAGNRST